MGNGGIGDFREIIGKFNLLPPSDHRSTWMEICRHPAQRFEEICSRILAFFIDPACEHGLGNLWMRSLLEASGVNEQIMSEYKNDVKVNLEEGTDDGKRIDIVVSSGRWVVAIENKITAGVYNDLAAYARHIDKCYPGKEKILIVLSLKSVKVGNGFRNMTYSELFDVVDKNFKVTDSNTYYISFMSDFIKTIRKMDKYISSEEYQFFIRNKENIRKLKESYDKFNQYIRKEHESQIEVLKDRMKERCGGGDWSRWNDTLFCMFNGKFHQIGIQANFYPGEEGVCDYLSVWLTTWKTADWTPYEQAGIMQYFAEYFPNMPDWSEPNRVWVELVSYKKMAGLEDAVDVLEKIYRKMSGFIAEKMK